MMNVLIIEDEPNAARQLMEMIALYRPSTSFAPVIDSLDAASAFLNTDHTIDLIFLDIHLSDGHAFDLFESGAINHPVIFSTAYDHYAIRAFEVNSLDYLLKPISEERLQKAIDKFENQRALQQQDYLTPAYLERIQKLLAVSTHYKETLLIPYRDRLLPLQIKDFAWFEIRNSVVSGTMLDGTVHILEERSLDELAKYIYPSQFYRANRQFLINRAALKEVHQYFNGKLLLKIHPEPKEKIIVSREKTRHFKTWVTA
jgi:two-component system LytT family response regulator